MEVIALDQRTDRLPKDMLQFSLVQQDLPLLFGYSMTLLSCSPLLTYGKAALRCFLILTNLYLSLAGLALKMRP